MSLSQKSHVNNSPKLDVYRAYRAIIKQDILKILSHTNIL